MGVVLCFKRRNQANRAGLPSRPLIVRKQQNGVLIVGIPTLAV